MSRFHSIAFIVKVEVLLLILWLVVAFVVNDDTSFRDWSIGLVSGVLFASIWLRLLASNNKVRRWFHG